MTQKLEEFGPYEYFDYIPIAVLVADVEGRIVYLNRDCARLFGYSREDAMKMGVDEFVPSRHRHVHAEYRMAYCAAPSQRIMGQDRIVTGVCKDGREIPLEVGLGALKTTEGVRIVATIQDISARQRNDAMLRAANEALARKNADLDEFVHMASHDLQEPLRKLISFSDLLREDLGRELPERAAKDVQFITESAYRMRRLVRDLLALSRAGKESLNVGPVHLNACIAEALENLDEMLMQANATVQVPELPVVNGDSVLITQLLQNLIANAVKFVPKGCTPVIEVTLDRNGGTPTFGVKDNGIGIAPEFHERIFGAFRRLHRRDEYDGSGVGLSICRKVVERHNGRIWVESEVGQGAHFRFTLGSA
ncbi:MAG: PAS domain S-box protein [Phycisphaerales bacterium]|nr:PAS domain S-box protein [Phycisphaerales bacterium]MCB9856447.1 PAS domain S-box protein [Phycisphaerales bacterium]